MSAATKRSLEESGVSPDTSAPPSKRVKLDFLRMLWSLTPPPSPPSSAPSSAHIFSSPPPKDCNIRRLLIGAKPAYIWACYATGLLTTLRPSQIRTLQMLRDEALGRSSKTHKAATAAAAPVDEDDDDDEEEMVIDSDDFEPSSESPPSSSSSDDADSAAGAAEDEPIDVLSSPRSPNGPGDGDIDVEGDGEEEEEDDDEEEEEEDSDEGLEMEVDDEEVMLQDLPPISALLHLQLFFAAVPESPAAVAKLDQAMRSVVEDGSAAETLVTILGMAGLLPSAAATAEVVPELKICVAHVERGQLHFLPTTNVADITVTMLDRI